MDRKEKAKKVLTTLKKLFPEAKTELAFSTPLELLVATILSAQCTDKKVNAITPALFARFKTPKDYADATTEEIEGYISSINFYKNKARSIKMCCKKIVEDFGGNIPRSIEEMTELPGVGRKTASIVLAEAFGIPALAVDTHVKRVAQRLGLASSDKPDDIEEELKALVPKKDWRSVTNLFILHGRRVCKAKRPLCEECKIKEYCEYYKTKGG
ncbi:MAG TPA: endonuclease III [Deltaproteobacteria bacterium]|nr:endonuclease III [Deltaproteobacteria bacterium]